jgi:hypothetical protein
MDFRPGPLYELPSGADPSWFTETLDQIRRERVGEVAVTLYIGGGGAVTGNLLDARDGSEWDSPGVIDLTRPNDEDDLYNVPVEEIVGFRLLPDPPIDHSDELRG